MTRENLPPEVERIIERAFRLRSSGKTRAGLDLLDTIGNKTRSIGIFHSARAIFAFELDDMAAAAKSARLATTLNPRARMASQILFHALFDLGKRDAAFREMRRFLRIKESRIFRLLLRDLARDLLHIRGAEAKWLRSWLEKMPRVRKETTPSRPPSRSRGKKKLRGRSPTVSS